MAGVPLRALTPNELRFAVARTGAVRTGTLSVTGGVSFNNDVFTASNVTIGQGFTVQRNALVVGDLLAFAYSAKRV